MRIKSSIIAAIIVASATVIAANKSPNSPSLKKTDFTEITNSQVISEQETHGSKSPIINNNSGNAVFNFN